MQIPASTDIPLRTLVEQYFKADGEVAERPRLTAQDLDLIASGGIPMVGNAPNPRGLRCIINQRSLSELGARISLDAPLSTVLTGIDAALRAKHANMFATSVQSLEVTELDNKVGGGQLTRQQAIALLQETHLALLTEGEYGRASAFAEKFRTYFVPFPPAFKAAVAKGLESRRVSWADVSVIEALHAEGTISRPQMIAALKRGYVDALGTIRPGHIAEELHRRELKLASYAPYLSELVLSEPETLAMKKSAVRSAGDWSNTRDVEAVKTRLAFIQEHRTTGDVDLVLNILVEGGERFLRSGRKGEYDAVVSGIDTMLESAESRTACRARLKAGQLESIQALRDLIAKNERTYCLVGCLSLVHRLGALSTPEFAELLVTGVEVNLHDTLHSRSRSEDRAGIHREASQAAAQAGLDWQGIFPAQKRVRVEGRDIAAVARIADHDFATPEYATFLELFIDSLPPAATAENVMAGLVRFLDSVDEARRDVSFRDAGELTPLEHLPDLNMMVFADACAAAVSIALERPLTVEREIRGYDRRQRWVVSSGQERFAQS